MNPHDGGTGLDVQSSRPGRSPGDGPSLGEDDVSTSLDELDSQLAALLADDAEVLARDGTLEAPSARLGPAVRARLIEARACLGILKRAWPREDLAAFEDGLDLGRSPDVGAGPILGPDPGPDGPDAGVEIPPRREGDGRRRIGRFTILGELGHGGFGIVYLAQDPALGRQVALKLPRLESLVSHEHRRRFLAEARVAARLDHPNIVPIYDVGELGDGRGASAIYIASAYCREGPLSAWIDRQGTAPAPDRIARLMIGLAEGVQYLHDLGIIHRDLKPSNVLLQRLSRGSGSVDPGRDSGPVGAGRDPSGVAAPGSAGDPEAEFIPRVADFGLARLLDQPTEQTLSGVPIGSPPFMSPEQARGRVRELGPATDVYGLGAILYVLLTGRPPFRGETTEETIRQVIQDEPVPPRRLRRGLPRDLETVCLTCLQKEPARRYPSASALRDDLARFLRGEPIRARPVSPVERVTKWARRRPATAALLAMLAATIVAGAAAVLWQWRHAVRGEEALRRQLYVEKMNRAARDWDSGHVEQVRGLLEETRPGPDQDDLRGFEWFHLDRLCRGDEATLDGHTGSVKSITLGDGGRILASSGEDRTIRLWDIPSRKLLRTLEPIDRTSIAIVLSPDGRCLASGSTDGILRIWDVSTGAVARKYDGHSGMILDIAMSADGKHLASGGKDKTARIWDLETGRHILLPAHEDAVVAVALSADAGIVASSQGRSIRIWDVARGRLLREVRGRPRAVRDLAFSPDGKALASAGNDGVITLWDVESGALTRWFQGAVDSAINGVAFSPEGSRLVSGGDDQMVTLWDVSKGQSLEVYRGHTGPVTCVAFGPDGRSAVSGAGDNLIKIWEQGRMGHTRILAAHSAAIKRLQYSPEGARLASDDQAGEFKLWDAHTGRLIFSRVSPPGTVTWLDFSPVGETIALAGKDGTLSLWDPGGRRIRSLSGHTGAVRRVAFHPKGELLASADDGEMIRIWAVADGRLRCTLPRPLGEVIGLAFDPDGSRLTCCDSGGTITTWEWDAGRKIGTVRVQAPYLVVASLDLRARRLASAGRDQSLDLWDLDTGALLHALQRRGPQIRDLALTPHATRLLSAGSDGSLRTWDPTLGKELAFFRVSSVPLWKLALRPDGNELATGDQAGIIRILGPSGAR